MTAILVFRTGVPGMHPDAISRSAGIPGSGALHSHRSRHVGGRGATGGGAPRGVAGVAANTIMFLGPFSSQNLIGFAATAATAATTQVEDWGGGNRDRGLRHPPVAGLGRAAATRPGGLRRQ